MIIPLGTSDWASSEEHIRRLKLRNMYLIDNPASPDGVSRVSRPTLDAYATVGDGPIVGLFRASGSIGGDWLVVSGDELYRFTPPSLAVSLGEVAGHSNPPEIDFPEFAADFDRILILRNGNVYSTDGVDLTPIPMPDLVNAGSIAFINGYFLISVEGTDTFYWLEPGDTVIDAGNFATAERVSDPIISIRVASDEIWLIGANSVEVWTPTGDADVPFERRSGRAYDDGCAATATAVSLTVQDAPALFWVTQNRSVVMARGSPNRVSTESVEELLRTATELRAWAFRHNRHDFYVLTADEFTVAFDTLKGLWSRWDTYGDDYFRAHQGLQVGAEVYAGNADGPELYQLVSGYEDDGMPVVREVAGKVDVTTPVTQCFKVEVKLNSGDSPDYEYEPMLELRWSDDRGNTWSDYMTASMGEKGHYTTRTIFRSLGIIRPPGRIFEFRFSGPSILNIDYAVMNELG